MYGDEMQGERGLVIGPHPELVEGRNRSKAIGSSSSVPKFAREDASALWNFRSEWALVSPFTEIETIGVA